MCVAGYGTHDGQGNVPTGAQFEKGTGAYNGGAAAACSRPLARRLP